MERRLETALVTHATTTRLAWYYCLRSSPDGPMQVHIVEIRQQLLSHTKCTTRTTSLTRPFCTKVCAPGMPVQQCRSSIASKHGCSAVPTLESMGSLSVLAALSSLPQRGKHTPRARNEHVVPSKHAADHSRYRGTKGFHTGHKYGAPHSTAPHPGRANHTSCIPKGGYVVSWRARRARGRQRRKFTRGR